MEMLNENEAVEKQCNGCENCDVVMQICDADTKPPHLRDFTEEIKSFIAKFPSFVAVFGGTSMRRMMWDVFGGIVAMHIDGYAIDKYGDFPTDPLTEKTAEDCMQQIQKYMDRYNFPEHTEADRLFDLLKIAHYASVAFLKLRGYEELFVKPEETSIDLTDITQIGEASERLNFIDEPEVTDYVETVDSTSLDELPASLAEALAEADKAEEEKVA